MCILTAAEEAALEERARVMVNGTKIFARHTKPGHQVLVYSMSVASRSPAAMILPLPVVPGTGEDGIRFIDLSGYPDFFTDMDEALEPEIFMVTLEEDLGVPVSATVPTLAVHKVGDFEASFVPTMNDWHRLDERFRLSPDLWEKLPDYSDWGFAVFQLDLTLSEGPEEVKNDIHPMAFEFPTRDPDRLFYPTVHVHDGEFHEKAFFAHTLYCQRPEARAEFKYQRDLLLGQKPTPPVTLDPEDLGQEFEGYKWYLRSDLPARDSLSMQRCQEVVDPELPLKAMALLGNLVNRDVWLGEHL